MVDPNWLQIIHSRGNHWITASTIRCEKSEVEVYDSFYGSLDNETKAAIENLLKQSDTHTKMQSRKVEMIVAYLPLLFQ